MKKIIFLTLLFLFQGSLLFAQPDTAWTRTFGGSESDGGYSVQQTLDGGYIITGYSGTNSAGGVDLYLVKTNANGDTVWTRLYGGWSSDYGSSVVQTSDSGYIVTGWNCSFIGQSLLWLLKINQSGDTVWTRTFEADSKYSLGNSVQQTKDGSYIVAGVVKVHGASNSDIWLIKTDANGDTVWTKTFGGARTDEAYQVQPTKDGGFIVVGRTLSFSAEGSWDIWLIKTDSLGDTLWTRTLGDTGRATEEGFSVQQTFDGGYVIIGERSYTSDGDDADVWLVKTDENGDTLWTRNFGGPDNDIGYSVCQTSDEGFIIASNTGLSDIDQDVWLIKTDAKGDTLWTKTLGGPARDEVHDLEITSDGGYVITGRTNSYGAGYSDVWLIKIGDAIGTEENLKPEILNPKLEIFPNPFTTQTTISCQSVTDFKIYDSGGRVVKILEKKTKIVWDGKDGSGKKLPTGIYFLGNQKMILF